MKSKYKYDCLVVRCWEETVYSPDQLREAVEHLRCAPPTKNTGLVAVTQVQTGSGLVMAMPAIRYEETVGKTPREVWAFFDDAVTQCTEETNLHPRALRTS